MTSNKKTVILVLVVLAVLLGLVCLLCTKVLRGEKEPTQVKYDDPVQARMHDEKYVAKLNEQLESRKEILKGLSAAVVLPTKRMMSAERIRLRSRPNKFRATATIMPATTSCPGLQRRSTVHPSPPVPTRPTMRIRR